MLLSTCGIVASSYHSCNGETAVNYHPFIKLGSKYYFINSNWKMNWFKSSEYCRSIGGDLANIVSLEEHLALEEYILARKIRTQLWFDGNDLAEEGRYMSHSTGQPIVFTKWLQNNPDNSGNEDCLEVCIHDKTLLMNDHHCENTFYAICQYRAPNKRCSENNSLMHQEEHCILEKLVDVSTQAVDIFKSHSQPTLSPTV